MSARGIMKLKLAWMYYDLLELYGDRGNIKALSYIAKLNNIDIVIDEITITDETDISNYDIMFLGGGTDYAQMMIYEHLLSKKSQIEKVLLNKGFILTICGGYQLFGKYYIDTLGNKIQGLNIFEYYSESSNTRSIGNVVIEAELFDISTRIIGFENHAGQTKNVKHPFGRVINGNGNESNGIYEGYFYENFLGTYLHGPLIPKNPEIGKYILEYVLKNRYKVTRDINISMLDNSFKAKEVMILRGNKI